MNTKNKYLALCIFLTIIVVSLYTAASAKAQVQDTIVTALGDTLFADILPDSILGENSGMTSPIDSDADHVSIVPGKSITYHGTESKPASITFEDMTLEAMKITLFFEGDSLVAEGIQVPANKDSFPEGYKIIGMPVFDQVGQEPLTGTKMVYNLVTKKAKILEGRTKFDGGFYYGDQIIRVEKDILQIQDGYYTTCDLEKNPHFHFESSHMKMQVGNKVVARPVILYIQNIPVFMIPFGVFPVSGGRNSGFIMPSYGESRLEGRYLQGMGYYYAPNDYMDAKLIMDYYEKSGVLLRGDAKYMIRYKMSGSVSGSITRKSFGDNVQRRWDLNVRHTQTIDPTMSLSANGSFVSDGSFYKDRSFNRDKRSQRFLLSSASLTKNWVDKNIFLSVNASRREDLSTGAVTETLPNIRFSKNGPIYLFRRDEPGGTSVTDGKPFYDNLSLNYNSSMLNKRSKTVPTGADTLLYSDFKKSTRFGVQHNISLKMQSKIFSHFNVNPSIQYKEEWFNEATVLYLDENNNEVTGTENGFFARRTGRMVVGLNTKLYGTFNPNIGRLRSVRHELTPTLSFSYSPDFSDPSFGYFGTYTDSAGAEVKYDRFRNSIYGATGSNKVQTIGINIDNRFMAKTLTGDTESTIDLLNINMSTSYNFLAPDGTRKLSDLFTSFRIIPFARLNLNMVHSFYAFDPVLKRRTNTLLIDTGKSWWKKSFIQLTSLTASTNFSIRSGKPGSQDDEEEEETEDAFNDEEAVGRSIQDDPQRRYEDPNDLNLMDIPWELSGSLQFRINRQDPSRSTKVLTSTANFKIEVTENWKVEYRGNFDLIDKSITSQDFRIYRDLHCWEFSFNWTPPNSSRSGFWLELRVKDPKLRDLRIKKTDYGGSALGYR